MPGFPFFSTEATHWALEALVVLLQTPEWSLSGRLGSRGRGARFWTFLGASVPKDFSTIRRKNGVSQRRACVKLSTKGGYSAISQKALRDILMPHGKNWLPTVLRQFLTLNSGGRGCLGEGRLGVPDQVWEFRFLPSFPLFPGENRSSSNVWENAWKSQTSFFQTSAAFWSITLAQIVS